MTSTSGPRAGSGACDRAPARAGAETRARMDRRTTRFRADMVERKSTARICRFSADVAELVDAHGSGPCGGDPVEVQVLSSASLLGAGTSQSEPPAESTLSP